MDQRERLALIELLRRRSGFVTGVPDSLLRGLPPLVMDTPGVEHLVAANEGSAIGLAAGWALGKGRPALVYMQNSGLCNALNPLLSLVHRGVYSIPVVLAIGWRGRGRDEPQHLPTGSATIELLGLAGVHLAGGRAALSTAGSFVESLSSAFDHAVAHSSPAAVLVTSGAIDSAPAARESGELTGPSRIEALRLIVENLPKDALVVATTGHVSRELDSLRAAGVGTADRDLLVVGSMGHASSIALGLARARRDAPVVCLDGDGALLMHMGVLASVGADGPSNFCHILLNNGRHDSVGGPATAAATVDVSKVAAACGYRSERVFSGEGIGAAVRAALDGPGPAFVEIVVGPGAVSGLGRPSGSLTGRKERFIDAIS